MNRHDPRAFVLAGAGIAAAVLLALVSGCDPGVSIDPPPPLAEDVDPSAIASALPPPDRPGTVDVSPIASEPLMPEQTLGSRRVRVDHNPGGSAVVSRLKRGGAALIDDISSLAHADKRAQAIALTKVEEGVMWAVKAATAESPE